MPNLARLLPAPLQTATRLVREAPAQVARTIARQLDDDAPFGPRAPLAIGRPERLPPLDPPIEWQHQPAGRRDTWWPMLSWGPAVVGDSDHNHWALGGCLEKLDRLTATGAQPHQKATRHRSTVDALKTLAKVGERWDSFNAGHCNQDAMRSAYFEDPRQPVTRTIPGATASWGRSKLYPARALPVVGEAAHTASDLVSRVPLVRRIVDQDTVTFSPLDVQGLMVLCMDDLVDRTQGNVGFEYVGFRYVGPTPPGYVPGPQNDKEEPYPHDVIEKVCKRWGQERGLAIIIDTKPGQTLDNRMFDGGRVTHLRFPPRGFERSMAPEGGALKFHHITFSRHAEAAKNIDLDAWVHTADDGTVTSGWIHDPERSAVGAKVRDAVALRSHGLIAKDRSPNPDFFWIAHLDRAVAEGAPWVGFADQTNPNVDMFAVWTLYMESLGRDWREIARQYPDRVRAHMAIAKERGWIHAETLANEVGLDP